MQDELRRSNRRSRKEEDEARQQQADANSLGYVSVPELNSVWMERMRRLDVEIWPRGRSPSRDEILEFFETIKIELFSRAGRNYREYCKVHGNPKPKENPADAKTAEDTSRARYEARQARLSQFR